MEAAVSDLDPTLRALLDAARPEMDPSAADRARLKRNFARVAGATMLATAVPTASTAAGAAVATGSAVSGVMKVIAALALLGAASGGIGYAVHVRARHASPEVVLARVPMNAQSSTAEAVALPGPSAETLLAPPPMPATHSSRRVPQQHVVRGRAVVQPPPGAGLEDEFVLVSRAQAALGARDPEGALALLDAHASRYPHGQLSEEREALRVLAGCSLGRPDAREKAAQFLKNRPESPFASRIGKVCRP
jgi:hypothetical protein